MICENCIAFQGLENDCFQDHYVSDGLEAANCSDYLYRGENDE